MNIRPSSRKSAKASHGRAFPKSMTRAERYPIRLWNIVNATNSADPAVMSWSPDGLSVVVDDCEKLIDSILPQFNFKPSNIDSFKRNLAKHFFSMRRLTEGRFIFYHPFFTRSAVPTTQVNTEKLPVSKPAPTPAQAPYRPRKKAPGIRQGPPPPLPEPLTYAEALAAFDVDTDYESE